MSSQQNSSPSDRVRAPYHEEVPFHMPDPATPAGQSMIRSLYEAQFIWLTTVDKECVPHSLPLGFLWDEEQATFLIYSMSDENREHMKHIRQNPKVGLHLEM